MGHGVHKLPAQLANEIAELADVYNKNYLPNKLYYHVVTNNKHTFY